VSCTLSKPCGASPPAPNATWVNILRRMSLRFLSHDSKFHTKCTKFNFVFQELGVCEKEENGKEREGEKWGERNGGKKMREWKREVRGATE